MAKKKTKYPANYEPKSKAITENHVTFSHYTTNPLTEVRIGAKLSEDAKADLTAAIDEVLHFHNL